MSFLFSDAHSLVGQAVNYRAIRNQMISGNIANIDTPYYQARDINFEDVLSKEAMKLKHKDTQDTLQLANTNSQHLNPSKDSTSFGATIFYRDGHMVRNDGNSVDLDVEMSELTKNNIMFNALLGAIKKDSGLMKTVIESTRNI